MTDTNKNSNNLVMVFWGFGMGLIVISMLILLFNSGPDPNIQLSVFSIVCAILAGSLIIAGAILEKN